MNSLSKEDELLRRLGLPTNEELVEGKGLNEEDEMLLKRIRVIGLELDDVWEKRIIRSAKANGRDEKTCAENYRRIAEFRRRGFGNIESAKDLLRSEVIKSQVGGYDLYGHLIWVEQILDVEQLVAMQQRLSARAILAEAVEQLKHQQRYRHIYILDVSKVRPFLLSRQDVRKALQELISFGSQYYPDGTHLIFIINAPALFCSFFALIKNILAPSTRAKIHIFNQLFLPQMASLGVPTAALPALIGGSHPGIDLALLLPSPRSNTRRQPLPPPPPKNQQATHHSSCFYPLFATCRQTITPISSHPSSSSIERRGRDDSTPLSKSTQTAPTNTSSTKTHRHHIPAASTIR
uniref:CRAL-TRIO domain-containing protein n=1 Tax=Aureoumbra lagunensis TaxID=44058 RepID=A0A7S3JW47_9STRA|mmetsp:Transcript_11713/g.15904  ORF Transcript_11713/g.15904 Transcript_11713/m.15904 type:complete len:350 (-) Transcript_11713:23-1072(-)